jgi:flagellar hook assembly protein FlgD
LAIYNIKGRKVIDTHFELQPGMNEYYWDGKSGKGSSGASGIYFYQVKAGTISSSGKLLILR